jgi:hypothetical protein
VRADTCAGRLCILSFPFCLLRCLATAALSGSCHRHSVQTGGGSGRCTERRHFSGSGLTVVRGRAFEVPWYALRTRLVSHSTFFRGSTNLTPCGRPAPAVNTAHSDRADRGSVPQAEALGVEDGWIRREAGRTCEDAALRARKNQGVAPCRTRSQLGGGWLQDEGSDFFSRRGWGRRGSGGARTAEPLWHGCKAAGRWSVWKGDQQPDSSCCSYDKGCRSTSGQMRRFHCIRSRRCGRGVSDFERVFTRRC